MRQRVVRLGMRIQNSVPGTLQMRELKARLDTRLGKSCADLFLRVGRNNRDVPAFRRDMNGSLRQQEPSFRVESRTGPEKTGRGAMEEL